MCVRGLLPCLLFSKFPRQHAYRLISYDVHCPFLFFTPIACSCKPSLIKRCLKRILLPREKRRPPHTHTHCGTGKHCHTHTHSLHWEPVAPLHFIVWCTWTCLFCKWFKRQRRKVRVSNAALWDEMLPSVVVSQKKACFFLGPSRSTMFEEWWYLSRALAAFWLDTTYTIQYIS